MPVLATSLLTKVAPYAIILIAIAFVVLGFLRNRTKAREDKMTADRDVELNQVSQLNAATTVSADMAKATTNKATADELAARAKDGTL